MSFLDLSNNVTFEKKILPRGEAGKLAWGIKRYLSLEPQLLPTIAGLDRYYSSLGRDRFYELMVMSVPPGRFWIKGLGKTPADKITMNDSLRQRVCSHFHISVREIPIFLEIWNNRGKSIADLLRMFGYNADGKTRAKRKKSRKKRKR